MTLPLQKKRELLFLALFAMSYGEIDDLNVLSELLMETLKTTKKNSLEAITEAKGILPKLEEIDKKIALRAANFPIDKIPHVEKTILRLAIHEGSIYPLPVVITEALRLAKKFATQESLSFINALLDAILKDDRAK